MSLGRTVQNLPHLLCGILLISVVNPTQTLDYSIKVTKFVCIDTPYARTELHSCRTVVRRNEPTLLDLKLTVPEVVNYLRLHYKLDYKFNSYRPFFFNHDFEFCEFLKPKLRDPAASIAYNILVENFPSLRSPCPHGNRTYEVKHWVDSKYLPKSVPAGEYRITTTLTFKDNVTALKVLTYLAVRKKGIFDSMIEW
ncbi:uncharacterized protein LOC131214337 [Anopheles bellator]|uniref:uncharacterized protein LOC131214337 n=1 Tax=Anopheles bellator TaxID=139047 RepID=UPI00264A119D|nr:uncharacterized protein LOC131214337 [Anopheles bellator]